LLGGLSVAEATSAWNRFLKPGDRLVGWGDFAVQLWAQESWHPECEPIDLRIVAAHRLKRRPGTAASAAQSIGANLEGSTVASGRARRAPKPTTLAGALSLACLVAAECADVPSWPSPAFSSHLFFSAAPESVTCPGEVTPARTITE
jgi:hypothetical protein